MRFLVWVFGFASHYHFIIILAIDYYHLHQLLFQVTPFSQTSAFWIYFADEIKKYTGCKLVAA
jgi:hypothetical protein